MLALSLFVSFLKTVNPFDLHVQVFFFPSAGKLPPTKSLIFAFLPLILLFTLGIQLIQRWDIQFLAYMCIIFFLIIFNSLCFLSPASILLHLPSQSSPLSIYFFPHCWCLLFSASNVNFNFITVFSFLALFLSASLFFIFLIWAYISDFSFHHSKLALWSFLSFKKFT